LNRLAPTRHDVETAGGPRRICPSDGLAGIVDDDRARRGAAIAVQVPAAGGEGAYSSRYPGPPAAVLSDRSGLVRGFPSTGISPGCMLRFGFPRSRASVRSDPGIPRAIGDERVNVIDALMVGIGADPVILAFNALTRRGLVDHPGSDGTSG
jgi:hypothetical protein